MGLDRDELERRQGRFYWYVGDGWVLVDSPGDLGHSLGQDVPGELCESHCGSGKGGNGMRIGVWRDRNFQRK